jgi:WD40 repeat protein
MRLFRRHYRKLTAAVLLAAMLYGVWWALPVRPRASWSIPGDTRLVAVSPDGRVLVTSGVEDNGGVFRFWDALTAREWTHLIQRHDHPGSVVFSPTGKHLALLFQEVGQNERRLKLMELPSGDDLYERRQPISLNLTGYRYPWQVVFAPDGRYAAIAEQGDVLTQPVVRLLDLYRRQAITELRGSKQGNHLLKFAFAPDARILAFVDSDPTTRCLRLWNVAESQERATLPAPCASFAFAPDGKTVATATPSIPLLENRVILWDIVTGTEIRSLPLPFHDEVNELFFGLDGRSLTAAHQSNFGHVEAAASWETTSWRSLAVFRAEDGVHLDNAYYSTCPNYVFRTTSEGGVLIDIATGEPVLKFSYSDIAYAYWHRNSMLLSPGGKLLAVAHSYFPQPHPWLAWLEPWLPGRLSALRSGIKQLVLYNLKTGQNVGVLPGGTLGDYWFSADGRTLAISGGDPNRIDVWDLPPRKPLGWFLGLAGLLLMLTLGGFCWQARRRKRKAAPATEAIPCGR